MPYPNGVWPVKLKYVVQNAYIELVFLTIAKTILRLLSFLQNSKTNLKSYKCKTKYILVKSESSKAEVASIIKFPEIQTNNKNCSKIKEINHLLVMLPSPPPQKKNINLKKVN